MNKTTVYIVSLWAGVAFVAPVSADEITAVSLDYCADQYLLALADKNQILSVTNGAMGADSFYKDRAVAHQKFSATAGEIIALKPTLALETWTANPSLEALATRVGTTLITTQYGTGFDTMFANIETVGYALGQADRAKARVATLKAKLKSLKTKPRSKLKVAYITPSGYTAGEGTIVDDVIKLAGFETYAGAQGLKGWQPLPLEDLVMSPPDVLLTSFFDTNLETRSVWSLTRHGLINDMMATLPRVDIAGKYLACNGLFAIDAAMKIREVGTAKGLFKGAAHD